MPGQSVSQERIMKNNQFVNDMGKFVVLFVLAVAGLLAIGLLLYGLLGYIDDTPDNPQRVLAALLIMSLPVAYLVGRREGQAHSAGVDRGINIKVGAQRQTAPAKAVTPPPGAQPSWQSLVPAPVDIRIQQAHDDDVVVL
jgi:hypothetical protein